jgi:hypothetical protein
MSAMLYGPRGEKVCSRHKRGVVPGTQPWFVSGCVRCEEKAAKDPSLRLAPSLDCATGTRQGRARRGEKSIDLAKRRKQLAARARFYAELPEARTV